MTIRNVKVEGHCSNLIENHSTGLLVEDSTLYGGSDATSEGVGFSNFTLRRVEIYGVGDGVRANGNLLVEDCWIHDLVEANGSHNDGIQVTEGFGITLRHNSIENANGQTSAIMLGADQGDIGNIVVDDNLLNGGGYTLYGGASPPNGRSISNIRLVNNHFGRKFHSTSGDYGPVTATNDSRISMAGNVWDDSGAAVK